MREGTDGPRKATPKADPSRQNLRRDPNGNTKVTITRQTPEQLHQRLTPSRQNLGRDPDGNTKGEMEVGREGGREGRVERGVWGEREILASAGARGGNRVRTRHQLSMHAEEHARDQGGDAA